MAYITFEECEEYLGEDRLTEEQFDKYILKAEEVVDQLTMRHYQFNDINEDSVRFRVKQFKKAICAQVLYFSDMDSDTAEGLNSVPDTVTVGRTTVSMNGKRQATGNRNRSLVATDTLVCLSCTGLLYRGI